MREHFLLNPKITYLNHGSFGACPKKVFESYQDWQRRLELDPVQFITNTGQVALYESKKALAQFIHADPLDLILTTNPSQALNTVIRSLNLKEGDEILTTNQEYGAMNRTWNYYCKKTGAKYVNQHIPLPIHSKDDFLNAFFKGVTSKTKIIFLSEITSPTALVFPAKEVCKKARELGIMTIIDGAHVPGHIPLDLSIMQPDVYTGACHKWLLAPKGNSFLYVDEKLQDSIDPLIISWGYESDNPSNSRYQDYHQMQGTNDFSAFLCIPDCLAFFKAHDWTEKTAIARRMLIDFYPTLSKELESTMLTTDESFLGQMISVPIKTNDPIKLKQVLYEKYKIEIPIMEYGNDVFLRVSFQPYNVEQELNILIDAIRDIQLNSSLL